MPERERPDRIATSDMARIAIPDRLLRGAGMKAPRHERSMPWIGASAPCSCATSRSSWTTSKQRGSPTSSAAWRTRERLPSRRANVG
jgi:hypothetical protein